MKNNSSQKITTLGVVIFSFLALLIYVLLGILVACGFSLLILKTSLPESALLVGCVLGSGAGLVAATAFLTSVGKMKGIISAAVMFGVAFLMKLIGNPIMNMGGYLTMNGIVGILFMMVFSLVGGVVGTMIKKKQK